MAENKTDPIQEFIDLPRDQQMATLQQLPPEKQDRLLSRVKEYRSRKNPQYVGPYDPSNRTPTGKPLKGDPRNAFQRRADLLITPDPRREEFQSRPKTLADTFARGVQENVIPLVSHPIESAKGFFRQAGQAIDRPAPVAGPPGTGVLAEFFRPQMEQAVQEFQEDPAKAGVHTTGNLAGMWATGEVGGRVFKPVAGKFIDTLKKSHAGGARDVAGTGTAATGELIEKTKAENTAEAAKVAEKNTAEVEKAREANVKQTAKRELQVEKHGQETIAAEKARVEKQDAADRKVSLERGVEHLEPELKEQLDKSFETAKANANRPYVELKGALANIEADPETIQGIQADAEDAIRGVKDKPALLERFIKSNRFDYDKLQGLREEIGKELRRGTLDPDVYTAYKKIMWGDDDPANPSKGITGEMESIARRVDQQEQLETGKNPGFEKKLKAARVGYRRYAEVFLDNDSPIKKALETGIKSKPGDFIKSFAGRDEAIERLAQFDPEIARRINTVRGYASEAKGIRPSAAKPKEVSPLPPKAPPVEPKVTTPEVKKLGPEDIEAHKRAKYTKNIEGFRRMGHRLSVWPAFYVIRDIMRGKMPNMLGVAGEVAGTFGGTTVIANLMEKPAIVRFFTTATPEDLAQIPPELRADMPQIVQAAQKQGIKVSPAFSAFTAATSASAQPKRLRHAFPAKP